AGSNMRYIEVYLDTAVLYLILTTLATLLLNFTEKKINKTTRATIKDNCA
ncbi:MAG TPA: amino acid ABC transporter permease, partial [Erysipelotrichaceae bacterium]|nr:amino acid ABC transporter permease [Erysipelotrichaceae bacterium]